MPRSTFCFNDTPTTEIYTLSLQRRSSDLGESGSAPPGRPASAGRRARPVSGRYRSPRRPDTGRALRPARSEEHTSELQSRVDLVCRLLLEKKKHIETRDDIDDTQNHIATK